MGGCELWMPKISSGKFLDLIIRGQVESLLPYLSFLLYRCPSRSRVDELPIFSGLGDRWWFNGAHRARSLTSEEREEFRRAMNFPVSRDEGQGVPSGGSLYVNPPYHVRSRPI